MSSFVIGKNEYIKVAGLCAGIASLTANTSHCMWIWDYERNCLMDERGYREAFTRCYELNYDSVCKQYHEEWGGLDPNDYDDEFNAHYKIGMMAADNHKLLKKLIDEIAFFFRSVNYQIEDKADAQIVNEWCNAVLAALVHAADWDDHESWGRFDVLPIVYNMA